MNVQICVLVMHQKDLQNFDETISANFKRDLTVPENETHLLAYFPIISKFFYYFYYTLLVNNVVMAVIPLMQVRHGKYLRLHPQVFPFSYEPGMFYLSYSIFCISKYY